MMSIVFTLLFSCVILSQTILAENEFLDECTAKTGINVTPEMLQKLHKATESGTLDMDTIPEGMLCLPKCVLEKRNVIDEAGRISTENLKADNLMKRIPKKEVFLNCMEQIDKIATCDDIKKIVRCRIQAQ